MKTVSRIAIALLAVLGIAGVGVVLAEKQLAGDFAYAAVNAVKIGDPMPDFKLTDASGKEEALANYKGKIVVLNFSSPNCPFSNGADPAINALAEKYKDKDVVFIGVDSNKNVTQEDLEKHRAEAKVPYAILKDKGNAYADAVGAKVTPELFIIDKEGKLAYHGAPDNRTSPEGDATEHYADDALAALTSGKPVPKAEVRAWGCGIKRG